MQIPSHIYVALFLAEHPVLQFLYYIDTLFYNVTWALCVGVALCVYHLRLGTPTVNCSLCIDKCGLSTSAPKHLFRWNMIAILLWGYNYKYLEGNPPTLFTEKKTKINTKIQREPQRHRIIKASPMEKKK